MVCYAFHDRIFSGAYSKVYKYKHLPSGDEYAVKYVNYRSNRWSYRKIIDREIELLGKLRHPNIIR